MVYQLIRIMLVLFSVTLSVTSAAATLEGYWDFDDLNPNEGLVVDKSGNGRHGVLIGDAGPATDVPTIIANEQSLFCSHRGDQVVLESFPGILGATARTVTAWVKRAADQTGQPMGILGYGAGHRAGSAFSVVVNTNNETPQASNLGLMLVNSGFTATDHIAASNPARWFHVAVVAPLYGYTQKGQNQIRLYINGQRAHINQYQPMNMNTLQRGTLRICGTHTGKAPQGFVGLIDDVAIFSGELTDVQIQQLALGKTSPADFNVYKQSGTLLHISEDLTIWQEDPAVKVFTHSQWLGNETAVKSVSITAASNEYEPFQLVVSTKRQRQLQVVVTDLKGPVLIPKEELTVRRVGYSNVANPSNPSFYQGLTPDPLLEESFVTLKEGETSSFWLTAHVPAGTPGGTYSGEIQIKDQDAVVATLALNMRVLDFELPTKTSAYTSASLHNPYYESIEQIEVLHFDLGDPFQTLKKYYKNLIEHRVKDYTHARIFPDIQVKVDSHNNVSLDFDAFDQMITDLTESGLERFRFPAVSLIDQHKVEPAPKWTFGNTKVPIFLDKEYQQFNPRFLELFNKVYSPIVAYLKSKGWLKRAVLSLVDEPSLNDQPTVNAIRNIAKLFKDLDSEIPFRVTSQPHSSLLGLVDIWEMNANVIDRNIDKIRARQALGEEVAFYNNLVPFFDFPGMRLRTQGWLLWRLGFNGTLSWFRVANWRPSPWDFPNGPSGKGFYGATNLLYPPKNGKGPIDSIRWELLREGLEDYEYLMLLEQLVNTAEQRLAQGDHIDPRHIEEGYLALEQVRSITYGNPRQFRRNEPRTSLDQPYTLDVSLLQTTRLRIASAIESLKDFMAE